MTAPPSAPSGPPRRPSAAPELRRHVLQLMLAVFALHGTMLGLYYALAIERRPASQRTAFLLVWTALAVAIVLVYLARVRAARVRARRARAAAGR